VDRTKKILTQKKGGLQAQARALGPIISCIIIFFQRKNRQMTHRLL
jgi:hypothetical protein